MTRRAEILDELLEHGYRSVPELAASFDVDASTIRRHLARLEELNLVQRTHGGALPVRQSDTPYTFKETLHQAQKAVIGAAVAAMIDDGQTLLLDSGSTTLEVAKHLTAEGLTIITNDLRIGTEVADRKLGQLIMLGGQLLPHVYTLCGPAALAQLAGLRVTTAVFGADSILKEGVFNTNAQEVELKQRMRDRALRAYLVADSSKFGREAIYQVFDNDAFDGILTDDGSDPAVAGWFPVPVTRVPVPSGHART